MKLFLERWASAAEKRVHEIIEQRPCTPLDGSVVDVAVRRRVAGLHHAGPLQGRRRRRHVQWARCCVRLRRRRPFRCLDGDQHLLGGACRSMKMSANIGWNAHGEEATDTLFVALATAVSVICSDCRCPQERNTSFVPERFGGPSLQMRMKKPECT